MLRMANRIKNQMSRIAVLIVAAGKGERSGRTRPKQYEALAGKPMLARSAEAFGNLPIRVVIGPGQETFYAAALPGGAAPIAGARGGRIRYGWAWKPWQKTPPILS